MNSKNRIYFFIRTFLINLGSVFTLIALFIGIAFLIWFVSWALFKFIKTIIIDLIRVPYLLYSDHILYSITCLISIIVLAVFLYTINEIRKESITKK